MTMQIKTIILYGPNGETRELNLKLGAVNVITGQSRTGKSAIIDIIDYCLGRSTFQIFEGVNRDVVTWYALRLQINQTQVFIAKPAPKSNASSQSSVFLKIGATIELPPYSELAANSNDAALITELSELIGISPNQTVVGEGQTRVPLKTTIDHCKFFLFQEQGEIANRGILFHRQGEQFMPQAIKDSLPYLLGVVPEDRLTFAQEERDARRRLRQLERKAAELRSIGGGESDQGYQLIVEAIEVGLLQKDIDTSTPERVRAALEKAVQWKPEQVPQTADEGSSLISLNKRIDQARRNYQRLYEELLQVKHFETEIDSYGNAATEQVQRLEAIGILPSPADGNSNHLCPVCGSAAHNVPMADEIRANLQMLEQDLAVVEARRPHLRKHAETLQDESQNAKSHLQALQRELRARTLIDDSFEAQRDVNARVGRVVGRISLYLESVKEAAPDASLDLEIKSLKARLDVLEDLLGDEQAALELHSALNRIGVTMTDLAQKLDMEFAGSPYRFDLGALTVVADTKQRAIPMVRMGSGENWLGCHLITLLALHKHFIENERPVPGFLVIDQPSQVYFPSTASYKSLDGTSESLGKSDADIDAVARMFELLKQVCDELAPNLQIIVTEHANLPESWFQEMLVEQPWRAGRALIPKEWLAK
jgi:hypothetical protein